MGATKAGGTMTPPERHETAAERADRNWNDLLQQLRVTQTGIQILWGFLLTLPFQPKWFTGLSTTQLSIFLVPVPVHTRDRTDRRACGLAPLVHAHA